MLKPILATLALLFLATGAVRAVEPQHRFRTQQDIEEFVKSKCHAARMPADQMQDILQGIHATFNEPEVRAKFLTMSDSRRVFLAFAMDDYQFSSMCDSFAKEPPLKRRHRVEAMRSGIRITVLWPTSTAAPAALEQLTQIKSLSAATIEKTFPGIEKMPEWTGKRRDFDLLLDAALEFNGAWTKPLPSDHFQILSHAIQNAVLPDLTKIWSTLNETQRAEWITKGDGGNVATLQSNLRGMIIPMFVNLLSVEQQKSIGERATKMQGPLPKLEKAMFAQSQEMNRIELEQILRVNAEQAKVTLERVHTVNQPKPAKPSPSSKP